MKYTIKQQKLKKIAKDIAHNTCPLRKSATNPVPGEGNPDANILFIGEAPGKNEDETGRPFVGAAGKFLEKLLAHINLKRADVFITSIEKFRPPKNRNPKREEIDACFPYLEKQIKVIKPKVIVALGTHALKALSRWDTGLKPLTKYAIGDLHGRTITSLETKYTYLFLYHPAAVFYNRKLEGAMFEDMEVAGKLI